MSNWKEYKHIKVNPVLDDFVRYEAIPGTGIDADQFWDAFSDIVEDLAPINTVLLQKREELQHRIDQYHQENHGKALDAESYEIFLRDIGYLLPEGDDVEISTANVDPEIATIAGPQLVVPVSNARFALNAANARWGSLFDALYGSDVVSETDGAAITSSYNPVRGKRVVQMACDLLDKFIPFQEGRHCDVSAYELQPLNGKKVLVARFAGGAEQPLAQPEKFAGYKMDNGRLTSILFRNNNLHIDIQIDRNHPVGKTTLSGIKDVVLESAISTIQDCEDSVAAVDAEDKIKVYRNWLGLMQGNLEDTFVKNGKPLTRRLNSDRYYVSAEGKVLTLPGRSLLLVRNVGHLMTTDAVLTNENKEIPEGIMDAMITSLCALHDFKETKSVRNSKLGSIYIVKPKMHGPEEVAFTNSLFNRVEDALKLPRNTLKVGVMDEERRTTVNLKQCIREVRERVVFINTGFLDRTGDEIHTSREAGPVLPKEAIKQAVWNSAYEDWNVDIGLACHLNGKAQIGKGMWAKPDEMQQMFVTKQMHPDAGASCAWVPSPTAATIHALHYHHTFVSDRQNILALRKRASLRDILTPPLLNGAILSHEEIQRELDNNVQGILGYVVRWIDQGIGCSKVPDINNVALMEDRATLRISSQHIANWLHHNICTTAQVNATLERMAAVVDNQNAHDPNYRSMTTNLETSIAYQAARDLIFKGLQQPNGYTEPVLHARRKELKAMIQQAV